MKKILKKIKIFDEKKLKKKEFKIFDGKKFSNFVEKKLFFT